MAARKKKAPDLETEFRNAVKEVEDALNEAGEARHSATITGLGSSAGSRAASCAGWSEPIRPTRKDHGYRLSN